MIKQKNQIMRFTVLLFLAFSCQLGLSQNCIPTAIIFTTQQQVDNFPSDYLGCTIIDGSVGISGSVNNLDSLINITQIGGNVLISNVSTLNDISGLSNVTKISGFLTFENLPQLTNVSGLESLTSVSLDLIMDNIQFTNLDALSSLDTRERLDS